MLFQKPFIVHCQIYELSTLELSILTSCQLSNNFGTFLINFSSVFRSLLENIVYCTNDLNRKSKRTHSHYFECQALRFLNENWYPSSWLLDESMYIQNEIGISDWSRTLQFQHHTLQKWIEFPNENDEVNNFWDRKWNIFDWLKTFQFQHSYFCE